MRDRSLAALAFFCFQLLTATLFLRPAEIFEELADLPIYEGLIISCLVLTLPSIEPHFRRYALFRQPISMCAVGMFVSVIMSHVLHFYLGGIVESGTLFAKTLVYYGLVITIVNSPRRLKAYLLNIAICGSIMVSLCLFDYWNVIDLEFIQHLQDLQGHDEDGIPIYVMRMRGTGIFMDPNDLSMVIVAAGTLCLYFLSDRTAGVFRIAWLAPILILGIALLETKSRGGMLAGVCAAMVLSLFYLGPKMSVAAMIFGAMLLPFVAGRSGDIDLEDGGTAHERITMWRDGFYALKSPDLFFGVGQGMYAEVADLVAHNSFVHAYVELGVIGGTCFFGCFFFAAIQLYRIGQLPEEVWIPELERMRPFLSAVLAGWCGSMYSLSRCYIVPTFLILGLMSAYTNLVWIHTDTGRPLMMWNLKQAALLTLCSAMMFVSLYAVTIVFT